MATAETIVVSTKEELKQAKERNAAEIVVVGKLASDIRKAKKIAYAGAGTIAALTAALAAVPFTGGLSAVAAVPIATLTGLEIAAIIAAASVGLVLLLAVFKDYDEVSYSEGRLNLKRKSK
ncbi:hypothetical protein B2J73_01680 [Stutzerimonas stutzeri]|uniref:hypothetical protein n=1 Tax=Stutzerimonas stutzeri TaxID=316 RepID=UPI0009A3B605|nr:hypothetical protein [Stutzerimonas stutzeri]OPG85038.1 hypothetical protein B2J73_01680 [Stutzerimonas stutzeri]